MKMDFLKLGAAIICGTLMACSNPKFGLPEKQDSFSQSVAYNNKVDILWIIDNSASMLQPQRNLSSQLSSLVGTLNSLKMDYHMAVVTTSLGGANPDGGKFLGSPKYVTSTTPDLVNNLASRMVTGESGSNNERGLESMSVALSPSYLANEGKGFLRNDALLVVIALSDEDDKSAVSNPVNYYTGFLDALKAPWIDGSRSWMFNFIGVLANSSACSTFSNYAEPGLIYMDLVKKTRGTMESICNNNLSSAVSNIRARIYQILTDFKLSGKPLVETIVVKINGADVPRNSSNGWDYIAETNSIRFYGSAVPAADASIKVDFKPAEAN